MRDDAAAVACAVRLAPKCLLAHPSAAGRQYRQGPPEREGEPPPLGRGRWGSHPFWGRGGEVAFGYSWISISAGFWILLVWLTPKLHAHNRMSLLMPSLRAPHTQARPSNPNPNTNSFIHRTQIDLLPARVSGCPMRSEPPAALHYTRTCAIPTNHSICNFNLTFCTPRAASPSPTHPRPLEASTSPPRQCLQVPPHTATPSTPSRACYAGGPGCDHAH